ncbi:WhiB family transcriptional regulator [Kitasatospora sp. CB01950]|uniref:WhiB family transcriptional regulator n=1 Tax=Kitasatospora sp. CB01950 TaxID=1703930 RepID=UPI0013012620|nr:WhiB family transcriptional regulator [Kitasatospora sp. CB01950]
MPRTDAPLPCAGAPELFHAPDGERRDSDDARARIFAARVLCASCPIQAGCRETSYSVHDNGIWAGETIGARKAARRSTALAAAA